MGLREEFEAWLLTDYRNDLYGAFEAGWNRQASPASAPEGWKIVPVEPTGEMVDAGIRSLGTADKFRAMLAAAPTPPSTEDRKDAERFRFLQEDHAMTTSLDTIRYHSGIAGEEVADMVDELEAKVEKLTKERDEWKNDVINGGNAGYLREQLAALAEQNEKMREALEVTHSQLIDGKVFTQQMHRRPYWRYSVIAAISLPNLSTPVLNKYRAEGMRMAAEICISKRVPNTRSGGVHWRNQACADVINTQADELEQSK